jgi:DNA-binding MarR family transcriptional regulator
MMDLDRVIHEPARLRILTILSGVDAADFSFLLETLGLTKGNLSSHMDKLEKAGYVEILKSFNGKMPHTDFRLTPDGREALSTYWGLLDGIRQMRQPTADGPAATSPAE